MKKAIFIIFALFTGLYSFAQQYPGITLGGNMAILTGDSSTLPNRSPRYGTYFGITWDKYINRSTYMQYGITYSQQGVKFFSEYYNKDGFLTKDVIEIKVDYIQFPIVWKERWSDIYTEIGAYIGVMPITPVARWYQYVYERDSISVETREYNSFTSSVRIFDIGPIFGIGYQFQLSSQFDAYINVRYRPGLLKVNKNYLIPAYQMNNQVFTFDVGIISIGKAVRHNRYLLKKRKH